MSDLLTTNDAALALRVSTRTLERWRVSGEGPKFVKLGKRVCYRPSDVDDWVESRVVGSTSAAIANTILAMTEAAPKRNLIAELEVALKAWDQAAIVAVVAEIAAAPELEAGAVELAEGHGAGDWIKGLLERSRPKPPVEVEVKVNRRRGCKVEVEADMVVPEVQPEPVAEPSSPEREPAQPEPMEPVKQTKTVIVEPSQEVVLYRSTMPTPAADLEQALEEMNNRHALIRNYGGKTLILSWEASQINSRWLMPVFQTRESFVLQYCNVMVTRYNGNQPYASPIAKAWLEWPKRRTYVGVKFLPGEAEKNIEGRINIWQGWGVTAIPGDWSLIRNHIVEVLACGSAVAADYIMRWLAWSIQNPAKHAEVALVLIGEKGTGKGTLARVLELIFGAHIFQAQSQEHVIVPG